MPDKKPAATKKASTAKKATSVKKTSATKKTSAIKKTTPVGDKKGEVTNVQLLMLCGKPSKLAMKQIGNFLNTPGGYKQKGESDLKAMERIYKADTGEALPKASKTIHFRSSMVFVVYVATCPKKLELIEFAKIKAQVTKPTPSGPNLRAILVSNLAYNMKEIEKLVK